MTGAIFIRADHSATQPSLTTPQIREFVLQLGGAGALADAFSSLILSATAVAAAGFGMSAVLRLSEDETRWRADLVLSGPVPRPAWLAGHLLGSAAVMVVAGVAVGSGHAAQMVLVHTVLNNAAGYWLPTRPYSSALVFAVALVLILAGRLYVRTPLGSVPPTGRTEIGASGGRTVATRDGRR